MGKNLWWLAALGSATLLSAGCGAVPETAGTQASLQNSSATPSSRKAGSKAATGRFRAAGLDMLTMKTGWAWSPSQLLWTGDGGAYWQDVTPPNLPKDSQFIVSVVSASTAWAAVETTLSDKPPVAVYATTDHGQRWHQHLVQSDNGAAFASCLSATTGWIADNLAGASGTEAMVIQSPPDGGKTWAPLPSSFFPRMLAGNGHPLSNHPIPAYGDKSGMTWTSRSTGFISMTQGGRAALVRTVDGGQNWHSVSLPHASDQTLDTVVNAPQFFGHGRGLLAVQENTRNLVVYRTRDGGALWQEGAVLPWSWVGPDTVWSFSDGRHGLALRIRETTHGAINGAALYATADAGQTWEKLKASGVPLSQVRVLDMVSATAGYAVAPKNPDGLWKTANGGRTWTPVRTRQPS